MLCNPLKKLGDERKMGVFSQPDVLQLGEVADFEALTFNLELNFF